MYDQIIEDIWDAELSVADWQTLRRLAGIADGQQRVTQTEHVAWIRRKEAEGAKFAHPNTTLHSLVRVLAVARRNGHGLWRAA